jgi:predicted nucleic acid-binding protein
VRNRDTPAAMIVSLQSGKLLSEDGVRTDLAAAKKRGLIPSARPVFAKLHASDFRISAQVISAVLAAVGES